MTKNNVLTVKVKMLLITVRKQQTNLDMLAVNATRRKMDKIEMAKILRGEIVRAMSRTYGSTSEANSELLLHESNIRLEAKKELFDEIEEAYGLSEEMLKIRTKTLGEK